MSGRLRNGILAAFGLIIVAVAAFHAEVRVDREVVCPLCGQVGREYSWFGCQTGREEHGGCCYQLWRKYVGGECAHRWMHTGNSTRSNVFGFALVCASGLRVGGSLAQGVGLRELEEAGRSEDVKRGLEVVARIGQSGDIRQLDEFLGALRPSRASRDASYEDFCARIICEWVERLGIRRAAEDRA
jgi:hypothetical protein